MAAEPTEFTTKGASAASATNAAEVPRTLAEAPPPRLLSTWDQTALWGNLGISLLLLVSATFVLAPDPGLPPLSLAAAFAAIAVGSLIGNALLGLAAVPGAETGAPAMVLLRGMLGWHGSWLPTACNIVQNIGWATFEVVIIAEAAARLTRPGLRPLFIVAAGVIATLMAVRPLGVVRGVLKKVAVWAVLASTGYLLVRVLTMPLPSFTDGSWAGFWKGTDIVIALPASWIPLAADYSRHSRTNRGAFLGAFLGYGAAQLAFFGLGVLAYASFALRAAPGEQVDVITSLLAVPVGGVALLILVFDELDEVFANIYSTVVSAQNVRPRLDRRAGVLVVGGLATVLALAFDIKSYENFLFLLGSVFVPLFGTFAVDYYVLRRRQWDTSERAGARWEMLVPWVAGFAAYQLVNPGTIGWWARLWDFGPTPPTWASASLLSLGVSAGTALIVGQLRRV
ncbi:MAG TPA: cytosine permease [Acidimicrobiales bacterium]|jgi:putative hydroxymethylpyrimidine transporter CytX|nr:cytosine permease [Acidimicrobiales bacterium]